MGLFDELSRSLAPHSNRLNDTINTHGQLLHYRLAQIEKGISSLGRPDTGDNYFRIAVNKKFAIGETELFVVGMNEFYPVQFITVNTGTKKTPAFTINANAIAVLAVGKEGTGTETIGGDVVLLPGERVTIDMEAEGEVELTLGMIRIRTDPTGRAVNYGHSEELLVGRNTHDPARDVIKTSTTPYESTPPETIDAGGSPVITR